MLSDATKSIVSLQTLASNIIGSCYVESRKGPMLKPEKFDIEMTEPSGITGNE